MTCHSASRRGQEEMKPVTQDWASTNVWPSVAASIKDDPKPVILGRLDPAVEHAEAEEKQKW